jgi:hypothetical protein
MLKVAFRVCLLIVSIQVSISAFAESWSSFSHLVDESDYIAQYQNLMRNGNVIGSRLVKVYWQRGDLDESAISRTRDRYVPQPKLWSLSDFNLKSDTIETVFLFYGRGQHLWTAGSPKGFILYPGRTVTDNGGTPGCEIACSASEFDDLLVRVGELKTRGESIRDILELPVFGRNQKAK